MNTSTRKQCGILNVIYKEIHLPQFFQNENHEDENQNEKHEDEKHEKMITTRK